MLRFNGRQYLDWTVEDSDFPGKFLMIVPTPTGEMFVDRNGGVAKITTRQGTHTLIQRDPRLRPQFVHNDER